MLRKHEGHGESTAYIPDTCARRSLAQTSGILPPHRNEVRQYVILK